MSRRFLVPLLAVVLALSIGPATPVTAAPGCDPFDTQPDYGRDVPTADDILHFDFGEVQMTVDDINAYLAAVDLASDRVVVAEAARSVGDLAINYAIVGDPARLANLQSVKDDIAVLMNPLASTAEVAAAAARAPVILWVAANVHGGEESGADASLHALYELAARDDCVVDEIIANALVVIMPT